MKYVDEYRSETQAQRVAAAIAGLVTRPWTVMELCGGQTHTLIRAGIDRMLPSSVQLVHGPGCPVCVTPIALIDAACEIARRPEVILTSFGDMLRVPGSRTDLLGVKSEGGDVRIVYSPLDALALARAEPGRQVVFFAVGFETTAPANAMAVRQARRLGLENFSILCSHVRVPPAMEAILSAPDNQVQGFLAAGHVCTVMGCGEYEPLAREYGVPIVVTGFEPLDLLQGLHGLLQALEQGQVGVWNQYSRVVRPEGSVEARRVLAEVFAPVDREWRGIGRIEQSGLGLAGAYARFDALRRFATPVVAAEADTPCIAGEILRGRRKPDACAAFGERCTPERPLGAPMVSAEGACAAYYHYGRSAR